MTERRSFNPTPEQLAEADKAVEKARDMYDRAKEHDWFVEAYRDRYAAALASAANLRRLSA